jgi:hypothetical protein
MSILEKSTHVVIIITFVLAIGILVHDRVRSVDEREKSPLIGQNLVLTSVEWKRTDHTVLVVLSPRCRFCVLSAPLYHKLGLMRDSGPKKLQLVALSNAKEEDVRSFLRDHDIGVDVVITPVPQTIVFDGTPTLFVVDSTGRVIASYGGRLSPRREGDLLRLLGTSAP